MSEFMDWLNPEAAEQRKQEEQEAALRGQRQARGRAAFNAAAGASFTGPSGFHAWAQNTMAPGMQAHANAAQQINSAIEQEMRSRVAQEREFRRMEHEKELARMKMAMQQKEQEGALIRALLNG